MNRPASDYDDWLFRSPKRVSGWDDLPLVVEESSPFDKQRDSSSNQQTQQAEQPIPRSEEPTSNDLPPKAQDTPLPRMPTLIRPRVAVSGLTIPAVVEAMLSNDPAGWQQLLQQVHLLVEHRPGLVLGIAGESSGCGATTVALALSLLAARAGNVATLLVDGSFSRPALLKHLQLDVPATFDRVLTKQTELADAMVCLGQPPLTLLGLDRRISRLGDPALQQLAECWQLIRRTFHLVIVDLGGWLHAEKVWNAPSLVDVGLLVSRSEQTPGPIARFPWLGALQNQMD